MGIRGALATTAGAVGWVGLVMLRLRSVEETLWIARDDAVITLSHARNAAQFGSIGVSPGGDRVEGFSSPLHFFVSYIIQLVAEPGYRSITIVILIASSALTGAGVVASLRGLARHRELQSVTADLLAVVLTLVAGAWTVASWSSVGWLGSGMENPVVVAAGVFVLVACTRAKSDGPRQAILVVALVVFVLARVELAAFAVPVVFAASWMAAVGREVPRRISAAGRTVGLTLFGVMVVHLLRKWYFGEWLPNTAVVQDRASGSNQLAVAALISLALVAFVGVAAVHSRTLVLEHRPYAARVLLAVAGLASAAVVVLDATDQTSGSIVDLFELTPLLPLVGLIGVLFFVDRSVNETPAFVDAVLLTLAAVPLAQYVALGPARLDPFRVAVIVVPLLAVWAASLALRLVLSIRARERVPTLLEGSRGVGFAAVLVVGMLACLAFTHRSDEPRRLNFEVASADQIIDVADQVRQDHLGEGLVLLANPDLGKVSFEKNAVMTDLGLLGDPLLTRIDDERPDLVIPYLHFIARPDVVELHGIWSCTYSAWLESVPFAEIYRPHDPAQLDSPASFEDCGFGGRWIIWVRADAEVEAEYLLTKQLLSADDPAAVVAEALAACIALDGDLFRCQSVRRSLQRASAGLRDDGTYDQAVAAMQTSPSGRFDVPLLLRNPGWAGDAYREMIALTGRPG